jgi:hypothetical protein
LVLETMGDRKAVSLSNELYHLIRTVDTVRELAQRVGESSFDEGAPTLLIASALVIVKERLRLIDRAVRGTVDPFLLWCRENDAIEPIDDSPDAEGEDDDVLLQFWSDKKTVRRLRRDLRSAKRRLRRTKRK